MKFRELFNYFLHFSVKKASRTDANYDKEVKS